MAQKPRTNKYGRLSAEQLTSWECSLKMAIEDYDDRPMKRGYATQRLVHLCKSAMLPLLKELALYRKATEMMAINLWPEQQTTTRDD